MTADRRVKWRERSLLVRAVRLLRTRHPRTFRDKVRYKMLRDHRPLLVTFADKAAVRDYVARVVGSEFLPQTFAIIDDPADLSRIDLPDSYVIKPTHGSGVAIVVSPDALADAVLPSPGGTWVYRHVRPAEATPDRLIGIAREWLAQLYGQGPNREWAYGGVKPRIIVEELLGAGIPDDYKFFVFHGRCRFIQVDTGRFSDRTQDFYRADWSHLPMSGGPPWITPPQPKPVELENMIGIAERLGQDTDFVRVDLYRLSDRIVFGELTSYPAGGDSPFDPEHFNEEFGRYWRVPRRYR